MRHISFLLATVALSGCMTAEQIAKRNAAIQAEDATFCKDIASHGELSYARCRLMMAESRQNAAAMESAQRQAAYSSMMATGAQMTRPQDMTPLPSAVPPQVRCRSVVIGGALQTVCQ